jgi:hypothetical protein
LKICGHEHTILSIPYLGKLFLFFWLVCDDWINCGHITSMVWSWRGGISQTIPSRPVM